MRQEPCLTDVDARMNTREDALAVSPWQERPDTTGDKPPVGGLSIARCGAGSRAMQERGDEPAIRAAPDLWRQGRACNTPRQALSSYSVDDIESKQASPTGVVTRGSPPPVFCCPLEDASGGPCSRGEHGCPHGSRTFASTMRQTPLPAPSTTSARGAGAKRKRTARSKSTSSAAPSHPSQPAELDRGRGALGGGDHRLSLKGAGREGPAKS
jgi:hypothetical protein